MVVKIKNFKLNQSENGGFDLIKLVEARKIGDGTKENPTGEEYIKETNVGYNMPVERCVEKIIHLIQCDKQETVELKEFLSSYKELKEEILNILK